MGTVSSRNMRSSVGWCRYSAGIFDWHIPAMQRNHYRSPTAARESALVSAPLMVGQAGMGMARMATRDGRTQHVHEPSYKLV